MRFEPYAYQRYAIDWIVAHERCGLFLEMGLGKTAITLSAIQRLVDELEVFRVLVIAPLRVASTVWAEEIGKWDHLQGLRAVKVLGTERERLTALQQDADIYVINRENVPWLVAHEGKHWPFDTVVIDELSSFKSSSAQRFRALRRVMPAVHRCVGLTGTPAPNGLIDLWAQVYLLDRGERLGRTISSYRQAFFRPGRRNGQIVYEWIPADDAEERIYGRLADLCVSMRSVDHLRMPECRKVQMPVSLPEKALEALSAMQADLVATLDGEAVTAASAAVLAGKLLQMAGGAVYGDGGEVHVIHDAKLDALEDIIEQANGQHVLVYYSYKHELTRIRQRFPQARELQTAEDVQAWNRGEVDLLLAHPASAGHGLNLQQGGHITVWYGLTWSLEQYQQANARLWRQGQEQPVAIYHLIAQGTMDERVMRILEGKAAGQDALIEAVKAQLGGIGGRPEAD